MKKIPPGAEASNILVGELEFLDRAVVAFVRLSPAVLLTGLAEVPIPTRYSWIYFSSCFSEHVVEIWSCDRSALSGKKLTLSQPKSGNMYKEH